MMRAALFFNSGPKLIHVYVPRLLLLQVLVQVAISRVTVRNRPTRVRCPNAIPTAHVRATQNTRRSRVPVQEVTVAAHVRHCPTLVIKIRVADTALVR